MKENYFVKTAKFPTELTSEQKVRLNRHGNKLFNEGRVEDAAKIFSTTRYSDGLTRVGDYYYGNKEFLTALKYYQLANNHHNVNLIVAELSKLVRLVID